MTHTLKIVHDGTHNPSATPDADGNYVVNIVRKGLSDTEITPANIRTNPTTHDLEVTTDGGTTWTPAPGQDPRHADQYRIPPRSGSAAQCDAAANMRARFKQSMDALIGAGNAITAFSLSLAVIVQFMFEVGWIIDALLYVFSTLFAAGASALNAAMTTAVYDQLENIFFCNIGSDGSVTFAQLEAIKAAVAEKIGGDATIYIDLLLSAWGEVGLSNAGATGLAVGSCGSFICYDCDGQLWDFTTGSQFIWQEGAPFTNLGTWMGTYWEGQKDPSASQNVIVIWIHCALPFISHLSGFELDFSATHPVTITLQQYNSSIAYVRDVGLPFTVGSASRLTHFFTPATDITDADSYFAIIMTTTAFQNMELYRVSLNANLP